MFHSLLFYLMQNTGRVVKENGNIYEILVRLFYYQFFMIGTKALLFVWWPGLIRKTLFLIMTSSHPIPNISNEAHEEKLLLSMSCLIKRLLWFNMPISSITLLQFFILYKEQSDALVSLSRRICLEK